MKFHDPLQKALQAMRRGEYRQPTPEETEAAENKMFQDAFRQLEKMRAARERIQHINVRTF